MKEEAIWLWNIFERGASLSFLKLHNEHEHLLQQYSYPGSYKTSNVKSIINTANNIISTRKHINVFVVIQHYGSYNSTDYKKSFKILSSLSLHLHRWPSFHLSQNSIHVLSGLALLLKSTMPHTKKSETDRLKIDCQISGHVKTHIPIEGLQ